MRAGGWDFSTATAANNNNAFFNWFDRGSWLANFAEFCGFHGVSALCIQFMDYHIISVYASVGRWIQCALVKFDDLVMLSSIRYDVELAALSLPH